MADRSVLAGILADTTTARCRSGRALSGEHGGARGRAGRGLRASGRGSVPAIRRAGVPSGRPRTGANHKSPTWSASWRRLRPFLACVRTRPRTVGRPSRPAGVPASVGVGGSGAGAEDTHVRGRGTHTVRSPTGRGTARWEHPRTGAGEAPRGRHGVSR